MGKQGGMTKITENTLFPLALVVGIVAATITITVYLTKIDNRLCRVEERLDNIVRILELSDKIVFKK